MKKSQRALLVAGMAVLVAAAVPAAAAAVGDVRSGGYDLEGSRYAAAETRSLRTT